MQYSSPDVHENHRISDICAVVVCYNTGARIHPVIKALQPQVGHILLVDNGSGRESYDIFQSAAELYGQGMTLLRREDSNLAAGQNEGIRMAKERGFQRFLLMDHDSIPEKDMVAKLAEAAAAYQNPDKLGIVAPQLCDSRSERAGTYPVSWWRHRLPGRRKFRESPVIEGVLNVVASGSLIAMAVYEAVGPMDEGFGIDYVDKDFCLRVVESGRVILAVRDAKLYHQLGDCRDHYFWKFRLTSTNHSPERRYTIYRNRIRCWRRHGRKIPAFVLYDFGAMGYDLLRVLFLEENRILKIKAMLRGMRDGVRGRESGIDNQRAGNSPN